MFTIYFYQYFNLFRFSGSLCGLAYIFALPPIMNLLNKRALTRLNSTSKNHHNNKHLITNVDTQTLFNEKINCQNIRIITKKDTLKWYSYVLFNVFIIMFGVLNFAAQFFMYFFETK